MVKLHKTSVGRMRWIEIAKSLKNTLNLRGAAAAPLLYLNCLKGCNITPEYRTKLKCIC